ncbi:MAG: hypothetical protein ABIB61_03630 [Candidatus Shapirobacteria bacterium]
MLKEKDKEKLIALLKEKLEEASRDAKEKIKEPRKRKFFTHKGA